MVSIFKNLLINICIILYGITQSYSQNIFLQPERTISYADGLVDENITCITKDLDGYLWLGTMNGLLRYNGSTFEHWTTEDSLSSNWIVSLFPDNEKIWIGTAEGLNYVDIRTNQIHHIKNQIDSFKVSEEWITGILKDENDYLWLYNNGLLKMDLSSGSMEYFNHNFGKMSNIITQVIVDKKDKSIFWCGTANGLIKFNVRNNTFGQQYKFKHSDEKYSKRINLIEQELFQDKNGKIYGCSLNGGLFLFDPLSEKVSSLEAEFNGIAFSNAKFKQIVNYDDNHLLMFCNLGLVLYNIETEKITDFYPTDSFKKNSFANSWRDAHDRIWINSDSGLDIYNLGSQNFIMYDFPDESFNIPTRVSKIVEDQDNAILYLIEDQGASVIPFDRKLKKFLAPLSKFDLNGQTQNDKLTIQDLIITNDNSLFLLTVNRLWKWENNRWKDTKILTDLNLEPYTSLSETTGGQLVISSCYEGIYTYNFDSKKLEKIPKEKLLGDGFWAMNSIDTEDDKFWIFQNGRGMTLWNSELKNELAISFMKDQLGHIIARDIVELNDGQFLICTGRSGIYIGKSNEQKLRKMNILDNDFDYYPYAIEKDKQGNLWVLTQQGFLKTGHEFKSHTFYKYPDNNFDITSELNIKPNFIALSDGFMAFAGAKSLCIFYPDSLSISSEESIPLIESVFVNNTKLNLNANQEPLELKHNENNIQFNLNLINYSKDLEASFKYKLEGIDNDWTSIESNKEVRFGRLPSGTYNFSLKATNRDRAWCTTQANFNFIIYRPWWKTYWAYFFYFLLGTTMFWLWYNNQKRKWKLTTDLQLEREKNAKLLIEKRADSLHALLNGAEKERKRISRELHDGIGPLLAAASMMMDSLQYKYKTLLEEKAYMRSKNLINKSVNEIRNLSHELMPIDVVELGLKRVLIKLMDPINNNDKIDVKTKFDFEEKSIPIDYKIHVYRILQELIKNTLSHSNFSFIFLTITSKNQELFINLSNDGYTYNIEQALQKGGLGLNNIFQRLEQMDAIYTFETENSQLINYNVKISLPENSSESI